jgi:hypothetical protein
LCGEVQFTTDQVDSLTAKEVFPDYPWWEEFNINITSFEDGVKKRGEFDQMLKKAVIPAAGLGTRFLPITKNSPKEMLPLVDKPAIQYVVKEAVASGIDDIIIITGRGKRAIEDHFDKAFELEWVLKKNCSDT